MIFNIQNLKKSTEKLAAKVIRKLFGSKGIRLVREILGMSIRHRIQVDIPCESVVGWTLSPHILPRGGIVYSVGIGCHIDFDLTLIEKFDVDIFAFDPTPKSLQWVSKQKLPENFHFIPTGIAQYDGFAEFYFYRGEQFGFKDVKGHGECIHLPVQRLSSSIKEFGHNVIDLLKVNIEGGEYDLIPDLLKSDIRIPQILIQFHHGKYGFSLNQTKNAVTQLNSIGYRIFNIGDAEIYSFVHIKNTV
jgi:FkbM family methyltransferase